MIDYEVDVLVSITNFIVLEWLILRKHPKTRTNHPNIRLAFKKKRELSFFSDKSLTFCSYYISSSIRHIIWCWFQCYLQAKMLLSYINEGSLTMLSYRWYSPTNSFYDFAWFLCCLWVLILKVFDCYRWFNGFVDWVRMPLPKFGSVSRRCLLYESCSADLMVEKGWKKVGLDNFTVQIFFKIFIIIMIKTGR